MPPMILLTKRAKPPNAKARGAARPEKSSLSLLGSQGVPSSEPLDGRGRDQARVMMRLEMTYQ
jgi:hypothetical protein